jgi:hypothetical protein
VPQGGEGQLACTGSSPAGDQTANSSLTTLNPTPRTR